MENQKNDLAALRSSLANLDEEILNLVKKRLDLCRGLAQLKIKNDFPLRDLNQEQTVLERSKHWAYSQGEDLDKTEAFTRLLMDWGLFVQKIGQK
jgi:hypothetical protein